MAQGFDISEVIQGNLLLKEAVMPIIWREAQWEADTALRLLAELDGVLHWIVIQVSKLYSLQLNRRLAEQVDLLTAQPGAAAGAERANWKNSPSNWSGGCAK